MADDFGLKIGLEGEKEFKKALSEINQSFKVLGSEMKVVQSQFDKNDSSVEALTARNQVLNKEIEAQKQKIETLRSALANASESFGENDRRTQQWQIQLNNATAALNDMERELDRNNAALDDAEREMDDVADSADDMSEELDDAGDSAEKNKGKFESLGSVLKGVGVAMGAVVTAAAAAAVSLGKAVVESYAEYEQLVGGVDTLFRDSSATLQEYANNAYKTAGMSANDYMSTVTSFSASLISSLGGDTEAAVKYADMAITDMADNANKMGTDIGLIQNAYCGFSDTKPWIPVSDNFEKINVKKQKQDRDSILEFYKKLIMLRKEKEVIARGNIEFMEVENAGVLAYTRCLDKQKLLVCCNFRDVESQMEFTQEWKSGRKILGNYEENHKNNYKVLTLRPYEIIVLEKGEE